MFGLRDSRMSLLHRLHSFIACAWNSRQHPQQWKDANIVTIYKRKGDRADCGNSHGISLLSAAGKVLARVMLRRLLIHVVDIVVPESQCGFRRHRSTIDMIFIAQLLQEKCREQSAEPLSGIYRSHRGIWHSKQITAVGNSQQTWLPTSVSGRLKGVSWWHDSQTSRGQSWNTSIYG